MVGSLFIGCDDNCTCPTQFCGYEDANGEFVETDCPCPDFFSWDEQLQECICNCECECD